jgi:hypothetical protein
MNISSVSNQLLSYVSNDQAGANQTGPTPQHTSGEDSVHLSPQAQTAASGDVDHDGDSH